jgi:hypothetical protein
MLDGYAGPNLAPGAACLLGNCNAPLRGPANCQLALCHSGRHSSQAFICDECGKTRRGTPIRAAYDLINDDYLYICFMCIRGLTRKESTIDDGHH